MIQFDKHIFQMGGSTTNQTIEVEAYASVAGEKPQEIPVNPLVLAEALLIWAVQLMVLKVW